MNGKCDKEIGRPGKGWHACNRKAVIETVHLIHGRYGCLLQYCQKHRDAVYDVQDSITVGSIKEL